MAVMVLGFLAGLLLLVCAGQALALRAKGRARQRERGALREEINGLRDRLALAQRGHSELQAVLSSMYEGVLVLDPEERVLSMNLAAAELLSIDPAAAPGRPLQELARNVGLQELTTQALRRRKMLSGELTLRRPLSTGADDVALEAHAAPVIDAQGKHFGAVVVMHDITRLRRLENIRKDFVANVSHEIKTPLSAAKVAVETLMDDPDAPPEAKRKFQEMIRRQVDRLDNVVEDLLSLARIEQQGERILAELTPAALGPVVNAAMETCHAKARAKSIRLETELEEMHLPMVCSLVEQSLVNLIDNAIKYSGEGTSVRIHARTAGGSALICVIDQGRGIEAEHLPRVFERFYRTDRARSRVMGGTGLGLSIVRHVAQCHGGKASARSEPGRGSTFCLHLPLSSPPTQAHG